MFSIENIGINDYDLVKVIDGVRGILPEILLAGFFVVLLLFDVMTKGKQTELGRGIALIGVVSGIATTAMELMLLEPQMTASFFNKSVSFDSNTVFIKLLFLISALLTLIFPALNISKKEREPMEYFSILFALLLGLNFMVMAGNLMIAFLAIETVSISSYVLVALRMKKSSTEASLKYLLFGAFSSGVMLYGMSMLYGIQGIAGGFDSGMVYYTVGVIFFLAGLLFKSSAAPFHIWTPDVYQGGYTPLVAFLSTAPKIAAVYFTITFCEMATNIMGAENISVLIAGIALASMFVGNFGALQQNNLKRMLGYSSIAHSGFLLVVVACGAPMEIFIFYAVVYLFANYAMFYFAYAFEDTIGEKISDFKGRGKSLAGIGVLLVIVLISLVGLPPTGGFWGKFLIFSSLYETIGSSEVLQWLLILGLFNAAISLFYYLRLPYYMYLKESNFDNIEKRVGLGHKIFITLLVLPILILFFKSDWLIQVVTSFQ